MSDVKLALKVLTEYYAAAERAGIGTVGLKVAESDSSKILAETMAAVDKTMKEHDIKYKSKK